MVRGLPRSTLRRRLREDYGCNVVPGKGADVLLYLDYLIFVKECVYHEGNRSSTNFRLARRAEEHARNRGRPLSSRDVNAVAAVCIEVLGLLNECANTGHAKAIPRVNLG